jgi:hypothetical protein
MRDSDTFKLDAIVYLIIFIMGDHSTTIIHEHQRHKRHLPGQGKANNIE